jgi:hydrogenase expression/formation protein HypE
MIHIPTAAKSARVRSGARPDDRILLGHGAGGLLSHELIRDTIAPRFMHEELRILDDAACVPFPSDRLVISTDGFVVDPPFFPGGDIGKLAVTGTVNDVAMLGARPLFMSLGLLIEEGFSREALERILDSAASAARLAHVAVVTGDTKVLPKGAADGIFLHTTGVGALLTEQRLSARSASPGDVVLVSGPIGDHGAAVMARRMGIDPGALVSDCAALDGLVRVLLERVPFGLHVLRDPTRGGLASTLNEIASSAEVEIAVRESAVPVKPEVNAICEILGLDPFYLACEGRLVAVVDGAYAGEAMDALRSHPLGGTGAWIGEVRAAPRARVVLETAVGSQRVLDLLAGYPLPRIC